MDKLYEQSLLEKEDNVADFLGIPFNKKRDDNKKIVKIELTQTRLIKQILIVTGMEDCTKITTPSKAKAFGRNKQGDPPMERWSYASVVGMLLYLARNSGQILYLRCINAPDLRIAQSIYMKKQ